MAKPTPDQITAENINQQFRKGFAGYSLTNQVSYANNWTRNVASTFGITEVRAANVSYGNNIPMATTTGDDVIIKTTVERSNVAFLWAERLRVINGTAVASANLILYSNGTGSYLRTTGTMESPTFRADNFIWRPSVDTVSTNYYVQFALSSNSRAGTAFSSSSPAVNTDLILTSTRHWQCGVVDVGNGTNVVVRGNLIMKYSTDGGTSKEEYFRRPFVFDVYAQGSSN